VVIVWSVQLRSQLQYLVHGKWTRARLSSAPLYKS
jgi:hypothetical protein